MFIEACQRKKILSVLLYSKKLKIATSLWTCTYHWIISERAQTKIMQENKFNIIMHVLVQCIWPVIKARLLVTLPGIFFQLCQPLYIFCCELFTSFHGIRMILLTFNGLLLCLQHVNYTLYLQNQNNAMIHQC